MTEEKNEWLVTCPEVASIYNPGRASFFPSPSELNVNIIGAKEGSNMSKTTINGKEIEIELEVHGNNSIFEIGAEWAFASNRNRKRLSFGSVMGLKEDIELLEKHSPKTLRITSEEDDANVIKIYHNVTWNTSYWKSFFDNELAQPMTSISIEWSSNSTYRKFKKAIDL